jgi:hypothetical protein
VAVGDLDGDGIPDLAVSYDGMAGAAGILVLAGNSDGTYRIVQNLTFGLNFNLTGPGQLAVADLNGDGMDDVVLPVDSVNGGGVDVLLGNGDGSFRDTGFTPTGATAPSAVAVGDFGNGFPDLAVTNFLNRSVSVFLGNGTGLFRQAPVTYTVGTNPRSVLVADLESNDILDIVTADAGSGTVSILPGNGDGTFQAGVRYLANPGTSAVVAGDFNGDSAPDLATANAITGDVSVLLNRNDGTGPHGNGAAGQIRPDGSPVGLAQAEHVAGIDALLASAQPDRLKPVVVNRQPAPAAVDAALASTPPAADTVPTGSPLRVEAGSLSYLHHRDRTVTDDVGGLTDTLTEAL